MGFLLTPIAWLLYTLLFIVDEFRVLVFDVKNRKWFKTTGNRKFKKAMSVDILGNYFYGDTLNWLFSKGGYKFGRFGETISSALGRKFIEKSLSLFGLLWYYILYAADYTNWRKGGHCIANIQSDEQINNFLKE